MREQTIFDLMYPKFKIDKPLRLIELFSGYGSQAMAIKRLNIPFEHWKTCEWAIKSIQAYKDIHFPNDDRDYSESFDIDYIKDWLFKKGISQNYNEPMTKEQIKRMSEKAARNTFNNIIATKNLVNISQVKGKDLEIKDTDKYIYICFYSFPCQDLSLAGKGKGMADTSTRSGLLWEVERILTECDNKPQILIMENVPQVHNQDNIEDFKKWVLRLEELGYSNYWQDLIATDYGIPQTRNRCFMVSLLGEYSYSFPPKQELKLRLKDMLEDNDGGISASMKLVCTNLKDTTNLRYNKSLKETLDQNKIDDTCFIDTYNKRIDKDNAGTITTGVSFRNNTFLAIKNANSKGYLEAEEGDGIDISSRMEYHRGTVQKQKAQTLTTSGGGT